MRQACWHYLHSSLNSTSPSSQLGLHSASRLQVFTHACRIIVLGLESGRMARLYMILTVIATCFFGSSIQFGFFDQMFGGQQQQQQAQNVRSDSSWYQAQYEGAAQCNHYLCPGTLSCVHFPHHCPCAWEGVEDKAELGEGIAICGSKGGWGEGEFAKKVDLARKGLL
ncbi:hypothetical protein BKA66DRAFT_455056 [Pyrenochaeta sp. MPI-SDFR-AT-0127]|nr:hypothetical protein BKA66DRAFT_455056 [Pyrenochaeta sp. MPI-SDFR-AT-0127]